MERLKSPKMLIALVLASLALTVFFQNGKEVDVKVLWLATVNTSLATALATAFLAGLVTGALVFSFWKSKRSKSGSALSQRE
jgi:uncharacterized membrane protein YciS (DUF1049 family)